MPRRPEFIDWLSDALQGLGALTARSMFGGWGLYLDGLIFAIVVDGELFIKADAVNRDFFTAAGSTPFQYVRGDGGVSTMNYYRVLAEVQDEHSRLQDWAREGLAASLRARAGKTRR